MDENFTRVVAAPKITFDVEREYPALLRHLSSVDPGLATAVQGMRSELPVAVTHLPFDTGEIFRLPDHNRAIYVRRGDRGLIAIKGSEIHCQDTELAATVALAGSSAHNSQFEHLCMMEHKIPGVLLHDEAFGEAHAAGRFQTHYLERFGDLARFPVPLLIVEWPSELGDAWLAKIRPFLSERSAKIARSLARDGLVAYVYYYPGTRMDRVIGLDTAEFASEELHHGYAWRKSAMGSAIDFRAAIDGWFGLVARMLALGYLPVTISHKYIGQTVRLQNCVLDGGLVDADATQPMSAITDAAQFEDSFWLMIHELTRTTRRLMFGPMTEYNEHHTDPVRSMIVDEIRRRLAEPELARNLDPRLTEILEPRPLYERLDRFGEVHVPPRLGD
jgi:hypothetical protein